MKRFNLIDEQWIPVRLLDGTRTELGIRDGLLRAGEVMAIEDASPLVVAGLYRLLLAVLYRALQGPADIEQAKILFKEGVPRETIMAYLEKWHDRFWLFHDKYPFAQIPDYEPRAARAWTVLAAEHNADNAKVLFDHVDVERPGAITEGAAARWLLATQTFAVSCGKSELSHTGTAPSATAAMALPLGNDLHESLILSLYPQNRGVTANDSALWERAPESLDDLRSGITRASSGFADLYTWRTRSIRFISEGTGVEKVAFASGVGSASDDQRDPMLSYRIDETRGLLPVQFKERGFWRDFPSLLPDDAHLAPFVIDHALRLTREVRRSFPHSVLVMGQLNDKAKIEFWRMERHALPPALAARGDVRRVVAKLLAEAEDAQKSLWHASRAFAKSLLSRGQREPAAKDIAGFVEQMPVSSLYWSVLEYRFQEMLQAFGPDSDEQEIRHKWLVWVRDALRSSWDQHRASVSGGDAWAVRALAKAEQPLRRKILGLNAEIKKLEPKEGVWTDL